MSLELDWLEREERYRRRVVRLMTAGLILAAVVLGVVAYVRSKHVREARVAETHAADQAKAAETKRQRDAFVADSTAAAERAANFMKAHGATPLQGSPFVSIPLPPREPVKPFVDRLWKEYVRVVDPAATPEQEADWYHQHYIEVLNDGPLRGRAVLLPAVRQKGLKFEFLDSSFTDMTAAQIAVGMREAAPAESTGAGLPQGAAGGGAASAPAPPDTGASKTSKPAPAEHAPAATPPAAPAPHDSVPKP